MHKHINTNAYIMKAQWQNYSCTRNIYVEFHKTNQTHGVYFVNAQTYRNKRGYIY